MIRMMMPMNRVAHTLVALLFCFGLWTSDVSATNTLQRLEQICAGEHIDLTKRTEMIDLAAQLRLTPDVSCPSHIRRAIQDLGFLMTRQDSELCTMVNAQRIRDFYLRYLDTSKGNKKEQGEQPVKAQPKLPSSLRQFAKALGLQVSNACNWLMIEILTASSSAAMSVENLNKLGKLAREDGLVARLLNEMSEPGEIVLPMDLFALMSSDPLRPIDKLHVQTKYVRQVQKIQSACRRLFQPIYEPLILPITTLASVGFNYKDKRLKSWHSDKIASHKIRQWSVVVFLCEGFKIVDPVDWIDIDSSDDEVYSTDDEANNDDNDEDGTAKTSNHRPIIVREPRAVELKVITKEHAEAIKLLVEQYGNIAEEEFNEPEERVHFDLKDYNNRVGLSNVIYDKNDSKLYRAMCAVKTSKTALGRIKGRMMKRTLNLLKRNLLKGHIRLVLSAPMKAAWNRLLHKDQTKRLEGDDTSLATSSKYSADPSLVKNVEKMVKGAMDLEKTYETSETLEYIANVIFYVAMAYAAGYALGIILSYLLASMGIVALHSG